MTESNAPASEAPDATITAIHTRGEHAIILYSDGSRAFLPPLNGKIAFMRQDDQGRWMKGWYVPGTPPSPILPMTDEESVLLDDYLLQTAQTPEQTLGAISGALFGDEPLPVEVAKDHLGLRVTDAAVLAGTTGKLTTDHME